MATVLPLRQLDGINVKNAFYSAKERLTRSLPRDVYIRRQNDHPGGQGRMASNFRHLAGYKDGTGTFCC